MITGIGNRTVAKCLTSRHSEPEGRRISSLMRSFPFPFVEFTLSEANVLKVRVRMTESSISQQSRNRKRKAILGQVSLEISVALICIFILGIASVKICFWLANQLAFRQENYERSRTDPGPYSDPSYPALSIFK